MFVGRRKLRVFDLIRAVSSASTYVVAAAIFCRECSPSSVAAIIDVISIQVMRIIDVDVSPPSKTRISNKL